MQSKQCTKCGETKPLSEFGKRASSKDGLRYDCKPCQRAHEKSRDRNDSSYRSAKIANAGRWAEENPDRKKELRLERQKDPERVAKNRESARRYGRKNKDVVNANTAKYRAAKLEQTPSWANDQLIAAYYKEAKRLEELTGIEFHVDHIIPLQGDLVSGLHVENNLQILTKHDNIRKSNKFEPATFCAHA